MSKHVAIIGAGPSGIVAAKFLQQQGLQTSIFEQSDQAGGQWHVGNSLSGIWPGMPTNTSRVMTQFSDLEHVTGTPDFPSAEQIQDYLQRYLDCFELHSSLRLNCEVTSIEPQSGSRWLLEYRSAQGALSREEFDCVLVASGRFNRPFFPPVRGLDLNKPTVDGVSISHSHHYKGPEAFKGKRVLVAGGAISALEIASDLTLNGASQVSCAYRNQRYVLGKLAGQIPTDHINFSLFEALAAERLDSDINAARTLAWILQEFGNPADCGARRPHADLRQAGATKCEHFLGLVAERRIQVRHWLESVDGRTVYFCDGSQADFDHIIFATGYHLELPFIKPEQAQLLNLDAHHIGLYQHTFHPDLPGLAVAGFYNQVGPYFPVLELQARWIACVWSQHIAAPDEQQMRQGLQQNLESWQQQQRMPMHKLAMLFARSIGAEPQPDDWPDIRRALWFGPLSAAVFRLSGPHALADAAETVAAAASAFQMISEPALTAAELEQLLSIGA